MCCCDKPNVNGTPGYSWDGKSTGTYPVAPPTMRDRDVLILDEPGRCGGMDSHSHHYRLVSGCGYELLVSHGGGEDRIRHVSLTNGRDGKGGALDAIVALDSDTRYWILNAIYHAYSDGKAKGSMDTREEYVGAFIQDRLKKRKSPGRDYHKVWIEPKPAKAPASV